MAVLGGACHHRDAAEQLRADLRPYRARHPAAILTLPTPSPADAKRALIAHAARALGIASESDLRDYFRLDLAGTRDRGARSWSRMAC